MHKVVDNSAAATAVNESLHLLGDLVHSSLIVDLLAAGEEDILNRLLYRALVDSRITYLTEEGGVLKEITAYTEEYLTRGHLTECGSAALHIDDRGLLLVCGSAVLSYSGGGGTTDKVLLVLNAHYHRSLGNTGIPIYSLSSLAESIITFNTVKAEEHILDESGYSTLARLVLSLDNVERGSELKRHILDESKASYVYFLDNHFSSSTFSVFLLSFYFLAEASAKELDGALYRVLGKPMKI